MNGHLTFYEWCIGAGSAIQACVVIMALMNFGNIKADIREAWFYFTLSMIFVFSRRLLTILIQMFHFQSIEIIEGLIYVLISLLWFIFILRAKEK